MGVGSLRSNKLFHPVKHLYAEGHIVVSKFLLQMFLSRLWHSLDLKLLQSQHTEAFFHLKLGSENPTTWTNQACSHNFEPFECQDVLLKPELATKVQLVSCWLLHIGPKLCNMKCHMISKFWSQKTGCCKQKGDKHPGDHSCVQDFINPIWCKGRGWWFQHVLR